MALKLCLPNAREVQWEPGNDAEYESAIPQLSASHCRGPDKIESNAVWDKQLAVVPRVTKHSEALDRWIVPRWAQGARRIHLCSRPLDVKKGVGMHHSGETRG